MIKNPDFHYGFPTKQNAHETKDIVSPPNNMFQDSAEDKAKYQISHGTYMPEEQKNRKYNWNLDIKKHYFGKANTRENLL